MPCCLKPFGISCWPKEEDRYSALHTINSNFGGGVCKLMKTQQLVMSKPLELAHDTISGSCPWSTLLVAIETFLSYLLAFLHSAPLRSPLKSVHSFWWLLHQSSDWHFWEQYIATLQLSRKKTWAHIMRVVGDNNVKWEKENEYTNHTSHAPVTTHDLTLD